MPILEEAMRIGQHKPDKVLIYNRPNMVMWILSLGLAYGDVVRTTLADYLEGTLDLSTIKYTSWMSLFLAKGIFSIFTKNNLKQKIET